MFRVRVIELREVFSAKYIYICINQIVKIVNSNNKLSESLYLFSHFDPISYTAHPSKCLSLFWNSGKLSLENCANLSTPLKLALDFKHVQFHRLCHIKVLLQLQIYRNLFIESEQLLYEIFIWISTTPWHSVPKREIPSKPFVAFKVTYNVNELAQLVG